MSHIYCFYIGSTQKHAFHFHYINAFLPPPPPLSSSSTHLYIMAKGEQKVTSDDSKFTTPTYDELARLLNEYTQVIMKTHAKVDNLKLDNKTLLAKCKLFEKSSD